MTLIASRNGVWARNRAVTGPSASIDSSVASHDSFSSSHSPPATDAATTDAVSTPGRPLVPSGIARQTYHAERQMNE